MKGNLLFLSFLLFITGSSFAQDFTGQWKGSFTDNSSSSLGFGSDRCDYVLELEVNGKDVTGYSYTYFTEGGRRYYTICSLQGFINRAEKYIEVREMVRTKTNLPDAFRNCFQVHKLTYSKDGDVENLEGTWIPAPNQGDCGYGKTSLQRRILKRDFTLYKNTAPKTNDANKKLPDLSDANKKTPPRVTKTTPRNRIVPPPVVIRTAPKNRPNNPVARQTPRKDTDKMLKPKNETIQDPVDLSTTKKTMQDKIIAPTPNFEKRNNTILRTIEVENVSVKVDLYDNGEIDGDSISLFYNGKLLLSHKRLSDKPISLNINVENDKSINELVMYAENLGSIPPNTALMIVTDGTKRYEVRITSDLQKSGTIRFVHKPGMAAGD